MERIGIGMMLVRSFFVCDSCCDGGALAKKMRKGQANVLSTTIWGEMPVMQRKSPNLQGLLP